MRQANARAGNSLAWWKPALFLLVLVAGLWHVKWQPYYGKALLAADTHGIGGSILANLGSAPLASAMDYSLLYFKAVFEGLDEMPPADPEVRAALDAQAAGIGWPVL